MSGTRVADTENLDYSPIEDIGWRDAWVESEHPRGQPENKGEFGPGGGAGGAGGSKAAPSAKAEPGAPTGSAKPSAGPASQLLPEPRKYSKDEAKALTDQVAAKLGYTKELEEARAKNKALGGKQTIDLVKNGGFMVSHNRYTPEREKLHKSIIDELFNEEAMRRATPKPGTKPTATILGGRGGSGKSWLSDGEGPVDKQHAIPVDADHFKEKLKPYAGWNAGQLHEESDHLVKLAENKAMQHRLNIIHDATMKSDAGVAARVQRYLAKGYDVEGHYMHLPPEQALERAISRFGKKQQKTGDGRFVPPEVILGNTENERNFDKLRPKFKKWSVFENTVMGRKPKLVDGSPEYHERYKTADARPGREARRGQTVTIRVGRSGVRLSRKPLGERPAGRDRRRA